MCLFFAVVWLNYAHLHDHMSVKLSLSRMISSKWNLCSVVASGMPVGPYLYASDLNEVLKKKHASGTYKSLVSHY